MDDFVSRLTLEECASLLNSESPAIERLGVKSELIVLLIFSAYDWRSNCLHGWGWWGRTTDWRDLRWQNFPMPVGLGATFDPRLVLVICRADFQVKRVADVTAREGRALHNMILEFYNGTTPEAGGLNCFSPNINLMRDPRYVLSQCLILAGVATWRFSPRILTSLPSWAVFIHSVSRYPHILS